MNDATERGMLDLLLARYNTERQGTIADRWTRAEHVRSTQDFRLTVSIADFVAIDKYASSQAIHGHEVKVSRADWLTELRDLTKSERVKRYCNFWWLVVSDASIVKPGELPEGWGLMVKSGCVLRTKTKAPELTPDPLSLDFICGLTAAVQRTAMREPLRRDARMISRWDTARGSYRQCQACGEPSPCHLHQPRATAEKTARINPGSESDGHELAAAILTRRLRKCIAQGAHQPDVTSRCPRCGLPQAVTELQPHGQPPTQVTPTTTEGRTDRCHGPEWETPQRTTPPRSPSSNISSPTKGL